MECKNGTSFRNLPQMKPGMLKTDRKIRRTEAVLVPHQTWTLPWRTEEAVTGIKRFVVRKGTFVSAIT